MRRESFGDRIERLRNLSEMSSRELDALAGLRAGHSRQIEQFSPPHVEVLTLSRIGDVLGVSIDWLYTGLGDKPSNERVIESVRKARNARDRKATGTG